MAKLGEFEHGSRVHGSLAAPATSLRLHDLAPREWATVVGLRVAATSDERNLVLRLTEIGFVPGEAVQIVARGPAGREPLAVRVGHTTFALRRYEASFIEVTSGAAQHG